jgi:hypothetical protein
MVRSRSHDLREGASLLREGPGSKRIIAQSARKRVRSSDSGGLATVARGQLEPIESRLLRRSGPLPL